VYLRCLDRQSVGETSIVAAIEFVQVPSRGSGTAGDVLGRAT